MGRRIRRLALFLLGGAAITVAVAWACAALVLIGPGSMGYTSGKRVARDADAKWTFVLDRRALGARRLFSMWDMDEIMDDTMTLMVDESQLAPSWARRSAEDRPWACTVHDARGLPLAAMYCEFIPRDGIKWSAARPVGGIELAPSADLFSLRSRALPLRPIWTGFAANSMFYAALLLVSFRGPGVLRRFVRNKSGRCIACGYDRRGCSRACPECGT